MKNIFIILAIVAVGGAAYFAGSKQATVGGINSVSTQANTGSDTAVSNTDGNDADMPLRSQSFGYDQFLKLIDSLNQEQRDAVLADKELVNRVINQELLRLSFVDAAKASQFAQNENAQYLLERQADDFLVTNYINDRLKAAGIPDGFPGEEQIQQFYENNKQSFSIGERMPVWQVFWSIPKDTGKQEVAKLLKLADSVSSQLRKGKITFAQAAQKYSQHAPSSYQGGFIGMLQTADLRPRIKEPLMSLKQNSVSKPIRSDNGLHIFRRGASLPAEVLSLDRVRSQVVDGLVKALRASSGMSSLNWFEISIRQQLKPSK